MNEKPSKAKFLRDNSQVVYSIFLMVIIPVIIIVNTLLCTYFFKNTINQGLQEKAVTIGESINAAIADKLDSPEQIQLFVDSWSKYNSDTQSLDIFYPEGENFKLIASLDKSEIGRIDNATLYTLTWAEKWPVAQKIYESNSQRNGYYWLVLVPLKNSQGEQKALLSMYLSTTVVDKLMSNTLSNSYVILIISVLIIVLLLFANSRIFEYAILYNKIKEIDQMKDEFISMASHELRTPITVIRGYIEMIMENKTLDQETRDNLSVVNISTERLNTLIEDLLDVSRIEQGRLKMTTEIMDVWPIIESTLKELKIQSDAKGLVLSSALDNNASAVINADKDRLKQVLINIIGNSIKYTPTGGVEVKAINRDKKLIIFIKDTGIGMSAKERERLFEKFYRVKNKKTTEISGTGLGLWITKQIIEAMSGTISIDSMEGVGTQVTLEFPLIIDNKKV
jgi:signal transduction histidine kinase